MKITKEMAKNAVAYINEHSFSASVYSYEDSNGEIKVYLQIDDFDFELSKDEIINRSILWLEEQKELLCEE
ncbi:hypothetical protein [Helicobacter pullorum]|uniref:hypothetical protein n=1 Tax=Helicobacter pullorum TaxID=35818 RepID=UPI000CF08C68|nr:hypothetical protein [Helicobacter pullorum]